MTHAPILTTVLVALTLAVSDPAAAALRFMGWGDATPNHQALAFDCGNPPAEAVLVVAFEAPAAELYGITAQVDMCTRPFDLPEWWRFDLPGACRDGTLELSTDFAGGPATFAKAWSGPTSASVVTTFGYTWSNAMNRFTVSIASANGQPFAVVPGTTYYAFRLVFHTPAGACDGCALPACFVINSLVVTTSQGPVETQMDYTNWTQWQGGQLDCPFIVGSAPATWGRVKAAYR